MRSISKSTGLIAITSSLFATSVIAGESLKVDSIEVYSPTALPSIGLPVKDVKSNGKWEMTNLIGQYENIISETSKDQDYILYLYDKAKKLKSKQKKAALLKQIRILSQHIGEYIVKPLDLE